MSLTLQEVILVGSKADQAKFSELTLDMFRILQTLEREPQDDLMQIYDASPAVNRAPFENGSNNSCFKRENPHKYLLYKPQVSQFLVFMSSGMRELPSNGALLLYISGEGYTSPQSGSNQQMSLYPSDLTPFLRRPLFLVIDSDCSQAFTKIPSNHFDQPFLVLMSPQEIPTEFIDESHKGSLYSLFLHSPLSAFCFVTNIVDIPIHLWDKCLAYIDRFLTEASRLLTRSRGVDSSFLVFMGDDFLRLLVCRHIFACVVLRVHKSFISNDSSKMKSTLPFSFPSLPEMDVLENPTLQRYALDLANQLDVKRHFLDCCGAVD